VPRSGQLADLALLDRIHRRAGKQQLRHGRSPPRRQPQDV
jgi:hypothetical protein